MAPVKRAYRSPRRRQQADETRQRILAAARRLFVSCGYGATTIEAIAREAGVANQTIYAAVGSKRALLMGLLDQMAADADLSRLEKGLTAARDDPPRQLRELLEFTARFYASGHDLIDLARSVSGIEPDLAAMWHAGEQRRHQADAAVVERWAAAGILAPGLTPRTATDLLWAMTGPDVFRLLVTERRWSRRRRNDTLAEILERTLFASPTSAE